MFPKDDIVPLLLKQNGLEGAHSTPHFRSKDKGVSIVAMGIAPQLVNGIRALGTLQIFTSKLRATKCYGHKILRSPPATG